MRSHFSLPVAVIVFVAGFQATAGELSTDCSQPSVKVARKRNIEHAGLAAAAKDALRASHAAKTAAERDAAARQLVDAFVELQSDQSLSIRERESLYHQVRNRLLAIEQGLRSVLNRARDVSESSGSEAQTSAAKGSKQAAPAQIDTKNRPQVLAQQMGPGVPPNGAQPPTNNSPNPGQQANGDYGQELLDLIQKIIRPSTWDINGGPSSGYYYQPLHALVISAPAEVHGEIGGVLGGLRQ
jgi:hypothetical protein